MKTGRLTGPDKPDERESVAHYRGLKVGTGSSPDDAGLQDGSSGHPAVSADEVGEAFNTPDHDRGYLGKRR